VPPPKRVLLVDDDRAIRQTLSECLTALGYQTHVALDGEHALRSAVALRPDLILLDVYLPHPDFAVRFAARYRERVPAEGRAPIIAMSGSDQLGPLSQQIGANDTLAKPFEMTALERLLRKYLDEPAPAVETAPADATPARAPEVQSDTGPA
jgi:two-component system response regulator MprA